MDPIDKELYQKYQADLRIEHLILEKEVQSIINLYNKTPLNETSSRIYYSDLGTHHRQNQLLEDIVHASLKDG